MDLKGNLAMGQWRESSQIISLVADYEIQSQSLKTTNFCYVQFRLPASN